MRQLVLTVTVLALPFAVSAQQLPNMTLYCTGTYSDGSKPPKAEPPSSVVITNNTVKVHHDPAVPITEKTANEIFFSGDFKRFNLNIHISGRLDRISGLLHLTTRTDTTPTPVETTEELHCKAARGKKSLKAK